MIISAFCNMRVQSKKFIRVEDALVYPNKSICVMNVHKQKQRMVRHAVASFFQLKTKKLLRQTDWNTHMN